MSGVVRKARSTQGGERLIEAQKSYEGFLLRTCEIAAENGAFGGCFQHPFHRTQTRASGRFNLFLGSDGAKRPESLHRRLLLLTFSTSTLTYPPSSSEGPILAPRALSPKWTPLHLPCASWLAVYIGLRYPLAFALASLSIIAL
jgi:hypothetical protein